MSSRSGARLSLPSLLLSQPSAHLYNPTQPCPSSRPPLDPSRPRKLSSEPFLISRNWKNRIEPPSAPILSSTKMSPPLPLPLLLHLDPPPHLQLQQQTRTSFRISPQHPHGTRDPLLLRGLFQLCRRRIEERKHTCSCLRRSSLRRWCESRHHLSFRAGTTPKLTFHSVGPEDGDCLSPTLYFKVSSFPASLSLVVRHGCFSFSFVADLSNLVRPDYYISNTFPNDAGLVTLTGTLTSVRSGFLRFLRSSAAEL